MEYTKNLSHSESKYKYLGLSKKIRSEFPEKDQIFKMEFKGKSYDMKVNNKDSIMISQLYDAYEFQISDSIKIVKKKNNYSLIVEKTE